MTGTPATDGPSGGGELAAALRPHWPALAATFAFSAAVNLLMLTSPLYMLQVYDRVLASRSEETLVTLSLLVLFLFAVLGVVDHARGRVLARIGARLRLGLDRRVHLAALQRLTLLPGDTAALSAERDLDAVARLWASPVPLALLDAPWTPVFLAALFLFHPMLGWLAVAGGLCLVAVGLLARPLTAAPLRAAGLAQAAAEREAQVHRAEAEAIRAMGMAAAAHDRARHWRDRAVRAGLLVSDRAGALASLSRSLRLMLQAAMLGAAAWLVLRDAVSPGAMVAASVLMGRALHPVDQAIGHWTLVTEAREARQRLAGLLAAVPPPCAGLPLPPPRGRVEVRGLAVTPPGAPVPVLRGIGFSLAPGQALGVIGPSGAGKTALARALTGAWPAAAGEIRLDGTDLADHRPETRAAAIGYLPQRVGLFDATVAQNIARLDPEAPADRVLAAARAAGAHETILRLPGGYDGPLSAAMPGLSGGQIQRLGLARALYGDPALLILDEPDAHLDSDGALALTRAIRAAKARGAAVILMAHRPAALQDCDLLLVLREGQMVDFGPRDRVLRDQVRNSGDIARLIGQGRAR